MRQHESHLLTKDTIQRRLRRPTSLPLAERQRSLRSQAQPTGHLDLHNQATPKTTKSRAIPVLPVKVMDTAQSQPWELSCWPLVSMASGDTRCHCAQPAVQPL